MKEAKKMKLKSIILMVVILCAVLLQTGCSETARTQSVNRRWDRVMEQARIDAAMESIRQGNLLYAIRLLEDIVESDSPFSPEAKEILEKLRFDVRQLAEARLADTADEPETMLN